MSNTLKEFQQKVKNRKFAIDNSWRGCPDGGQTESEFYGKLSENNLQQELPWRLLEENLSAANECKFFDGYLPLHSNRRILGRWIVLMKRIIRRLLKIFMGWYIFPQYQRMSHFNGKVINVLQLERDILANTVQQSQQMAQRLNEQEKQFHEVCQKYEALIQAMQDKLDVLMPENERLQQQGKEVIACTQELQNIQNTLIYESKQLNVRMRKLENLPTDDDEFYHQFEERFRGPQEVIRDRLQVYVPVIKEYIKDWSKASFIDVGSGRGEWLDILREHGAEDYVGVDLNARQNALCEERGHKVVLMDCIEYLREVPDDSADLITGFQVIEHLCMDDLMELMRQSYRVLKSGGMILFETPNPRNLLVGADTFYIDPSHKRPLDPSMVSFLAEWCGYTKVQCIDANSYPNWAGITIEPSNQEAREIIAKFNDLNYQIYGPQDYALIGIRK